MPSPRPWSRPPGHATRVADVKDVSLDGRSALVVLLEAEHDIAVGSAPAHPDPQRAAALATLAALERLSR